MMIRIRLLFVCFLLCAASGAALAQSYDYTGWWWDSQQGGTGYSLEVQCNKAYLVWYAYRDDGLNTWVSSILDVDGDTMAGELWRYEGWSLETGYQGSDATPEEKLGTVSLEFTGENAGSLTFAPEGGDEAVVRVLERRLTGEADPREFNGWWWDTAKPGIGWFLEAKDDPELGSILSAGCYNYRDDPDGEGTIPRFYVTWAPFSTSDTLYSTPLLDYSGGQTLTGPYVAPGGLTTPGDLSVAIPADFDGALDFEPEDGPSLALRMVDTDYDLTRFVIPGSDCLTENCVPKPLYTAPIGLLDLLRPTLEAIFEDPCNRGINWNSVAMWINDIPIDYAALDLRSYDSRPDLIDIRYSMPDLVQFYTEYKVLVTVENGDGLEGRAEWSFYAEPFYRR